MEYYTISLEGIKKCDGLEQEPGDLFALSLFSPGEWDSLDRYLEDVGPVGLTKITARLKEAGDADAVNPGFEWLSPHMAFVCYRDLDPAGREVGIRFLLTPQHITMLEVDHLDLQQVSDWAVSGLLKTAPDLAQLLGMGMLEHHQKRLEQFEDQMDSIEDGIMDGPRKPQLIEINALHKQIIRLKKSLNAHETIFARLAAMDNLDNGRSSWLELVAQTQRELENARQTHELVVSLRESYQMAIDNWSNDIMKVLTLLATILLPITLVTGFFGMNFEHLPLIHSPYGMISFYLLSGLIISSVLLLFWRERWLK